MVDVIQAINGVVLFLLGYWLAGALRRARDCRRQLKFDSDIAALRRAEERYFREMNGRSQLNSERGEK